MSHHAQILWFAGCPNTATARTMLRDVITRLAPDTTVEDLDVTDASLAERLKFPGSPTIRIDGVDVEPGFRDPADYTPRCRLYRMSDGLSGVPDRVWVEEALRP